MKTIILNHKSYLSYEEIKKYKEELEKIKTKETLVLFPNIAYLSMFNNSKLNIGSQNFYSYNYGSYTGEISLESLKSMNINYTLVGHPERLLLNIDTFAKIKDKLFRSINMNFKTILCIGHDERITTIKKELKYYLKSVEYSSLKNLIIAYEPINKIEGEIIDLKNIENTYNFIKKYMNKHFEIDTPIIYGGSVNKENINDILKITDGVLIGKTSLDITEIKEILKNLNC